MPRPREFDRDRAVQRAMELFWRQGYEATSVQELGAYLGLNPGSLYNTFKDKHTLFLEALGCYQEREHAAACAHFNATASGRAAIEQFLTAVVDIDVNDPDRKGCLMVNSATELADRDPAVRARVVASCDQMTALLRAAVVEGQRAGEIDAHSDPDALAAFLMNGLFGLRVAAKMQPDRMVLLAVVATIMRAL